MGDWGRAPHTPTQVISLEGMNGGVFSQAMQGYDSKSTQRESLVNRQHYHLEHISVTEAA